MLALAVAWSRPAWRTILGRGGHSMGDELPALPPDTVLASIGRFATRYPDGRWLDALARRASQGALDAADVLRRVRQGRAEGLDPRDLAWLGFLVAADPRSALQDVVAVLDHALAPPDPPEVGARVWSLYLQALYGASGPDALGQFGPDRLELVDPHCRWGVETDSMNPFLGADASPAAWLAALSRPFTESGAAPLELSGTDSAPFDRLAAGEGAPLDGDLVSVIMPVYNPDQSLLTAARSVLAQTWHNLELLLCDDGTTSGRAIIEQAAALDDRVRVLRSDRNAGAYSAQNRGLAAARGRYVTIHGADDFSHPERIERHIAALTERRSAVATLSHCVRASAQLELTALGRSPRRVNLSSLLFEREVVLPALGGFDSVRRAADTEFIRRIEAQFSPESVLTLPEPLAVIQTTPDSLSRNDFGMLRRSPAREAYRTAFDGWHTRIADGTASALLRPSARGPFPAPAHITGVAGPVPEGFDLVFLANPMAGAPVDLGSIVEVCADAGLRVAIVEFLGAEDARRPPRPASAAVARAVADGSAHLVLPGETVSAPAAVLLDADAALLMPGNRLREVHVDQLYVAAQRTCALAPAQIRAQVEAFATGPVHWLPADAGIADDLQARDPAAKVRTPVQWHLPPVSDHPHRRPPSGIRPPVVGMVPARGLSPGARRDWLRALVPRHAGIQLRRFGRGPGTVRQRPVSPVATEIGQTAFLDQLDYLLAPALPRPQLTELVVAAWARGVVVLAENAMAPHLADAALYPDGEPDGLIAALQEDPERYRRTQQVAATWVREHATPGALSRSVRSLASRSAS